MAVQCGESADWDYVPEVRGQLWAEALSLYNDWLAEGSPNPMPNLLPPELREAQELVNSLHTGSDAGMEGLVDALEPIAGKYLGWDCAVKLLELWEQAHRQRSSITAPGLAPTIPSPDRGSDNKFGAALRQNGWMKHRYNGRWFWYR